MERSFFRQVKEAISRDSEGILRDLGVQLKGHRKGDWHSGLCPCGVDSNASAGYTDEGFMHCFQCGKDQDLFDWRAEQLGTSPWRVCQDLGAKLGVDFKVKKSLRANLPKKMTHEILQGAIYNLWETDQAQAARDFLAKRSLANPQLLERFGVGWLAGHLVFAQFSSEGSLQPHYRTYLPGGGKRAWGWVNPGRSSPMGFWPHFGDLPSGDPTLVLVEGEWDSLTAWSVLLLNLQGYYVVTWTGGATSPIPSAAIPKDWHGKRVEICYDNDVFQGPIWAEHRAPDEKRLEQMALRRHNLTHGVAPRFLAQNCKVFLRSVPIDPLLNFGADLRDWVSQGGAYTEMPIYPWKDVKPVEPPPLPVNFEQVFSTKPGTTITTRVECGAIEMDGIPLPERSLLLCDMNTKNECSRCLGPEVAPEGLLVWKELNRERAAAFADRNPEQYILKNVISKPTSCQKAEVVHDNAKVGSKWWAINDDADGSSMRELIIFTDQLPQLSGQVDVTGKVWLSGTQPILWGDEIAQVDSEAIDLNPYVLDLESITIPLCNDSDAIERYLRERTSDLSNHVTKIYGRHDIHVAHDLLLHSVLGFGHDGVLVRGWIDSSTIGETRTGKSLTYKRLLEFHGLGVMHTCMENISRAGLTMGADKQGRLRPGLFPRSNRKLLVLDEFHIMVERARAENPLNHLQSARDEGYVHGVKIYGARKLQARVRFATIGNWSRGRRQAFRYECEHFLSLYGRPEAVSRLDFGLVVPEAVESVDNGADASQSWERELVRALALRAWAMKPEDIIFEADALELARQACSDWKVLYDTEKIPLFTPEEKLYSIRRIATSCANICFSHPKDSVYKVVVRKGHVEWALEWLQHTWQLSRYDHFSRQQLSQATIDKPFDVEANFTFLIGLNDPHDASNLLPMFFNEVSNSEIATALGKEQHDAALWISKMLKNKVMTKNRDYGSAWFVNYTLTKGGHQLLRNLLMCADDYPAVYKERLARIKLWLQSHNSSPGMIPLNVSPLQLRSDWDEHEGEENVFAGPGAG